MYAAEIRAGAVEQDDCQLNGSAVIPLQRKNLYIYIYMYHVLDVYEYYIPGYTGYIHLLHTANEE